MSSLTTRNRSRLPARANKISGDAFATAVSLTGKFLLQLVEINGERWHLLTRQCEEKLGAADSGNLGSLFLGNGAARVPMNRRGEPHIPDKLVGRAPSLRQLLEIGQFPHESNYTEAGAGSRRRVCFFSEFGEHWLRPAQVLCREEPEFARFASLNVSYYRFCFNRNPSTIIAQPCFRLTGVWKLPP